MISGASSNQCVATSCSACVAIERCDCQRRRFDRRPHRVRVHLTYSPTSVYCTRRRLFSTCKPSLTTFELASLTHTHESQYYHNKKRTHPFRLTHAITNLLTHTQKRLCFKFNITKVQFFVQWEKLTHSQILTMTPLSMGIRRRQWRNYRLAHRRLGQGAARWKTAKRLILPTAEWRVRLKAS